MFIPWSTYNHLKRSRKITIPKMQKIFSKTEKASKSSELKISYSFSAFVCFSFVLFGFPPPKFKLFQFNIRRKMQHYLLQYFFVTLLWFLKVLINKTIIFAFYFDWYLPFFMYRNNGETDIYRLCKYLILHLKILMSNKLTKKLECTIAVWCNRTIRILRGDCLNFDCFFWPLISMIQ